MIFDRWQGSREVSTAEYGVIIDPHTWTVNEPATAARRGTMHGARTWSGVPFVDRGPLPSDLEAAEERRSR